MFEDYFEFDDSNGGGSISPAMEATLDGSGATAQPTLCVNGSAAGYPCEKIDLQSFVAKSSLGGGSANLNDIWGWTDPLTGAEIAIVGLTDGTSFVDITDPVNPVYLGKLASHNGGSDSWRDIKVYNDHAFIVADGGGNRTHGLQVFDLNQLRNINNPPRALSETAHLNTFGNAHNIAINEDTGYAYVVGSNQCSGGLFMVNISNPRAPRNAGCFSRDGYTHDAQCVLYSGPDSRYSGREICFGYNEDTITIVDVTNKSNPVQIAREPYAGSQYTHQGWLLDENHSIAIMNDELDEARSGVNTTSYIFDVSDLRNPVELGRYRGATASIDHNLYTKDGYVFEANYRSGLRILSTDDIASGDMDEVASFDVIPGSNAPQFSGAWSSYIYFESGNIVVSDIGGGLFVVKPDWEAIRGGGGTPPTISVRDMTVVESPGTVAVNVSLSSAYNQTVRVVAYTREATAKQRFDYYGLTRNLTFAPGETSKTVWIQIVDNATAEPTENFRVRLIRPENATIADEEAVVTITDNDTNSTPSINVDSVTVRENVGRASFRVSLSSPSSTQVSANIHTRAGTAVGGRDYYGFTQRVVFAPGETSKMLSFVILNDTARESTETLTLRSADLNGVIPGRTGTATITDDD